MGALANSEDADEMPHNALFAKIKSIFIGNHNLRSLNIYNGCSQMYCINQREESIGTQRVNTSQIGNFLMSIQ